MTKPVTLSEEAFAALRQAKREGESDSRTILRLIREARRAARNPMAFVGHPGRTIMTAQEHRAMLRADRKQELQQER